MFHRTACSATIACDDRTVLWHSAGLLQHDAAVAAYPFNAFCRLLLVILHCASLLSACSDFSNTGSCVDLFAPGVSISSLGHTSDKAQGVVKSGEQNMLLLLLLLLTPRIYTADDGSCQQCMAAAAALLCDF
jgi:hypothetical protein